MSILIKGMDMMREGQVLVIDSTGQVWSNEWPTRGYIKIDKATVVPVPTPHGRLGDIDAIATDIYSKEERALAEYNQNPDDEYLEGIKDGLHMAAKRLSFAPTIIEAEE